MGHSISEVYIFDLWTAVLMAHATIPNFYRQTSVNELCIVLDKTITVAALRSHPISIGFLLTFQPQQFRAGWKCIFMVLCVKSILWPSFDIRFGSILIAFLAFKASVNATVIRIYEYYMCILHSCVIDEENSQSPINKCLQYIACINARGARGTVVFLTSL